MRYIVHLHLSDIEFKMVISADTQKEALKSMLDVARNYPDQRMKIVSVKPEIRNLPHSA